MKRKQVKARRRTDVVPIDFPGVFQRKGTDDLFTERDGFHRPWDPRRSKLAAYILKGVQELPFKPSSNVLYLGAANGTTAGHVADICHEGTVYCVEVSKRSFRDLIKTCEVVDNMIPILGNARTPHQYAPLVGKVDIVYQDIAQRDQAHIFLKNIEAYSNPSEELFGILMVKSRSIDVAERPRNIYSIVLKELQGRCQVLDRRELDPYEKDHMAILTVF